MPEVGESTSLVVRIAKADKGYAGSLGEHVLGRDGVTGSNPVKLRFAPWRSRFLRSAKQLSIKRGKQKLYLFFYKIKAMPEVGESA